MRLRARRLEAATPPSRGVVGMGGALELLTEAFPSLGLEVVEAVLAAAEGDVDAASAVCLELYGFSDEAAPPRQSPQRRSPPAASSRPAPPLQADPPPPPDLQSPASSKPRGSKAPGGRGGGGAGGGRSSWAALRGAGAAPPPAAVPQYVPSSPSSGPGASLAADAFPSLAPLSTGGPELPSLRAQRRAAQARAGGGVRSSSSWPRLAGEGGGEAGPGPGSAAQGWSGSGGDSEDGGGRGVGKARAAAWGGSRSGGPGGASRAPALASVPSCEAWPTCGQSGGPADGPRALAERLCRGGGFEWAAVELVEVGWRGRRRA